MQHKNALSKTPWFIKKTILVLSLFSALEGFSSPEVKTIVRNNQSPLVEALATPEDPKQALATAKKQYETLTKEVVSLEKEYLSLQKMQKDTILSPFIESRVFTWWTGWVEVNDRLRISYTESSSGKIYQFAPYTTAIDSSFWIDESWYISMYIRGNLNEITYDKEKKIFMERVVVWGKTVVQPADIETVKLFLAEYQRRYDTFVSFLEEELSTMRTHKEEVVFTTEQAAIKKECDMFISHLQSLPWYYDNLSTLASDSTNSGIATVNANWWTVWLDKSWKELIGIRPVKWWTYAFFVETTVNKQKTKTYVMMTADSSLYLWSLDAEWNVSPDYHVLVNRDGQYVLVSHVNDIDLEFTDKETITTFLEKTWVRYEEFTTVLTDKFSLPDEEEKVSAEEEVVDEQAEREAEQQKELEEKQKEAALKHMNKL